VIEDWRTIYNLKRPHRSRGWKPPAAYAASLNRQPGRKQPDSHNGWTDKRGPASCLSIGTASAPADPFLEEVHARGYSLPSLRLRLSDRTAQRYNLRSIPRLA